MTKSNEQDRNEAEALPRRNQTGLTPQQIASCQQAWHFLCSEKLRELDVTRAANHSSKTQFVERDGKVYLGANAFPGHGITANERMSMLACLAHELAHAERFEMGFQRPFQDLRDEAETSLHASFNTVLPERDREDLVEDARDRLLLWLSQNHNNEVEL